MALLGNLLWFVFGGGFFAMLGWAFVGVLLACTVVGVPFAVAAFRVAGFAAFPFGRDLVDVRLLGGKRVVGTGLANLLWIVLAGLWLALGHLLAALALAVTIIGIPFALAHFKLAMISWAPLGKRTVSNAVAEQAERGGFVR